MQQNKLPQLRKLFIKFSVAIAMLPAITLSLFWVLTLKDNLEQKGHELADFQANALADTLSAELVALTRHLSLVAKDNDVASAAISGSFSEYAVSSIKNWLIDDRHGFGAIIFDLDAYPTEAVPVELLMMDTSQLEQQQSRSSLAEELASTEDIGFALRTLPPIDGLTQAPQPTMVFYTPLHLETLKEAPAHTRTGTLAVLMAVAPFLESYARQQAPATLLSFSLNDTQVFKAAAQDTQFIRKQSLRQVSDQITLSLEVGIPVESIQQQVHQTSVRLTLSLAAALVTLLLISYWGARRLLSPFQEITQVVAHLSQGHMQEVRTKNRFLESTQLANLLNQLQRRVIRDQSELESQVEQRTQLLSKANQALEQKLVENRALQKQLVETKMNAQLGQLVAGVAHEINTPLGISLTASSMLGEHVNSLLERFESGQLTRGEMKKHLSICQEAAPLIQSNLERGAELIRTFKELSVDQSSGMCRSFLLGEYIHEVVLTLAPEYKRYQLQFDIQGDEELLLTSYPGAFGHILTKLVLNSLKHGFSKQQQHRISIHFEKQGDQLQLTYQDDGKGADAETLSRMFEPFYTTDRFDGHTGLGMHIVYNQVSQTLGGTIQVQARASGGLQFIIHAPLSCCKEEEYAD